MWQNFIHKTDDTAKTSSTSTNTTDDSATQSTKESSTATYTLGDAALDISKVLKTQGCSGKGYSDGMVASSFNQVADTDSFQYVGGKSIINTSLTYAYVQYGCGSGGEVGLMKRESGAWKLVGEDARIYPMCSVIEGQGFPQSIVNKCYVNDTDTEPTAV